jgi:hypothetical protein
MKSDQQELRFGSLWTKARDFPIPVVSGVQADKLFNPKPKEGCDEVTVFTPWLFRYIVLLARRENSLGVLEPSGQELDTSWATSELVFDTERPYKTHGVFLVQHVRFDLPFQSCLPLCLLRSFLSSALYQRVDFGTKF